MGLVQIHEGANFSAIRRGIRLAVPGAVALHLFGGTLAASAKNFVIGGADGAWVGAAPVPQPTFVPIDGSLSGMDTGVVETADMTVLMVARSAAQANNAQLISTNTAVASVGGATINGVSLFVSHSTDSRWTLSNTRHNGAGVNTQVTAANLSGANLPPVGQWTLAAFRLDATRGYLADLTRSRVNTSTSALARNPTLATYRIGSRKSTFASNGAADLHSVLIYPSWLSDEHLALAAAQMRALAAQQSITV